MLTETLLIGNVKITPAEFSIIQQAMKGHIRKQIADTLGKSETTLDGQMRTLYIKTGVERIGGLVAWASAHGFDSAGNYSPAPAPAKPAKRAAAKRKKANKKNSTKK